MKKTLMIDLDNVITNGSFKHQIEDFLGEKIDISKTGYYLQEALGDKQTEFFQQKPFNMYENAPLKNNAYDVIKKLNEVYQLYIVTAYDLPGAHFQEGNHLKAKMDYLQKKLPFINTDQIIFLDTKELIHFDIIIDDSIKNLKNGDLLLLFNTSNNQALSEEELHQKNITRVMNWQEIADILL